MLTGSAGTVIIMITGTPAPLAEVSNGGTSMLYYWTFPAIPKMPKGDPFVPNSQLFSQIYMLKLMYPDPAEWETVLLKPLIKLFKKYSKSIDRRHVGFPYRWKSILKI